MKDSEPPRRLRLTLCAWILILLHAASGAPATQRQPANVMSFEGAGWLEREERAEAEKPELVLAAMELRPGMTVAEIGAVR